MIAIVTRSATMKQQGVIHSSLTLWNTTIFPLVIKIKWDFFSFYMNVITFQSSE